MDLHTQYEIAIQRMVNLFVEFIKKIKAMVIFLLYYKMYAVLVLYTNIIFCALFLKQKCLTLEELIDDLNIFKNLIEIEMRTTPMVRKTYEIKIRTCQKDLKMAVKDIEGIETKKKNTFMFTQCL